MIREQIDLEAPRVVVTVVLVLKFKVVELTMQERKVE